MIFKLKIDMGTTGAKDADDIAALLMEMIPRVAAKVGEDGEFGLVRDEGGKKVGRWDFSDGDPEVFKVGDEDTTGNSFGCDESFYDSDGDSIYSCSRECHSSGEPHVAGDGSTIIAVWATD